MLRDTSLLAPGSLLCAAVWRRALRGPGYVAFPQTVGHLLDRPSLETLCSAAISCPLNSFIFQFARPSRSYFCTHIYLTLLSAVLKVPSAVVKPPWAPGAVRPSVFTQLWVTRRRRTVSWAATEAAGVIPGFCIRLPLAGRQGRCVGDGEEGGGCQKECHMSPFLVLSSCHRAVNQLQSHSTLISGQLGENKRGG